MRVTAGGTNRILPGTLSRYADDTYVYPDPRDDCRPFLDDLISFLEQTDHAVVFPLTDQLSVLLSKHKSDL
ncbi:MAG: ATP-grasp domain-containing protein, partial [Halobacteriota archaeon]